MHIDNMVLEVTRKCNLKCAHCLRGCAQRLTMSREVLCNALRDVEAIYNLTFTGGEPSLAPEVIEDFLQECYWRKIDVQSFYIVTNAMPHNKYRRFLNAVHKLYGYCDEKGCCSLTVSRDQYHSFHPGLLNKFDMFRNEYGEWEERPYFRLDDYRKHIIHVIDEGRAEANNIGTKEREIQAPWEFHDDIVNERVLYISANGNVTSSCDMSFHRIDKECKGNVLQTPLREIIESFCTNDALQSLGGPV